MGHDLGLCTVLMLWFQDTENEVSKQYVAALENALDHGVSAVIRRDEGYQVVYLISPRLSSYTSPR